MSGVKEKMKFIDQLNTLHHTVFYKLDENSRLSPCPPKINDKWDEMHVRMPCSPFSFHPADCSGRKSLIPRWKLIKDNLSNKVTNIYELKENIMSYNSRFESQWNFDVILDLFESDFDSTYKDQFFSDTYPGMVKLALDLPNIVTQPIPLLKSQKLHSLSFSQLQIASLLANAFFCTFPRRNRVDDASEYRRFPSINFSSLFSGGSGRNLRNTKDKREKLKCLLHYFRRVVQQIPEGVVTFTRRVLRDCDRVDWRHSDRSFDQISLVAHCDGSIFDAGIDRLKIDFANKSVGGGVLNNGCVQEEILFVTQPELIISCLFTEILEDNECLLVQGTESFMLHSGYARTFVFDGDFDETASQLCERDKFGRWKNTIAMIDALPFTNRDDQFTESKILRDLNKAFCGFSDIIAEDDDGLLVPKSVATGNWGCGAFRGDVNLKFLLQVMACTESKKNIIYYTFGDVGFVEAISAIFQYLQDYHCTVGALYRCLFQYCEEVEPRAKLFDYIKSHIDDK